MTAQYKAIQASQVIAFFATAEKGEKVSEAEIIRAVDYFSDAKIIGPGISSVAAFVNEGPRIAKRRHCSEDRHGLGCAAAGTLVDSHLACAGSLT